MKELDAARLSTDGRIKDVRADYCLQCIGYAGIYLLALAGGVAAIRLISLFCQ